MRRLLILLSLSVIFLNAQQGVAHEESNAPVQMARLRKKGSRNDGSCTDESLRKIMHEELRPPATYSTGPISILDHLNYSKGRILNHSDEPKAISDDLTESKRAVHRAVTNAFEGSYGVLCAECAFSYIIHTHEYCTHTRNDITCLVYKDA